MLRPVALLEAKIAKANNLSVRVVTSLPGADSSDDEEGWGAAVDLLVCEVMDPCLVGSTQVGLLGSGLLATLKECRSAGILGPKTQVLPRAARVYAQAIYLPPQTELVRCPIGRVSAFDLSPFGKFRADGPEPIYLSQLKYTVRKKPIDLNPPCPSRPWTALAMPYRFEAGQLPSHSRPLTRPITSKIPNHATTGPFAALG